MEYILYMMLLLSISPNYFLLHQLSLNFFDFALAMMTVAPSPLFLWVFFSTRRCFHTLPIRAKMHYFCESQYFEKQEQETE